MRRATGSPAGAPAAAIAADTKPAPDAPADLRALFGPRGPLSEHLAGYEPRDCQVQMAEFVDDIVAEGGRGVVEADTGTGKSLAYLVPVLRSGRRAIVSTSTKTLQDQLWSHDLPLAARVAGVAPSTALLKGRANYLCLLSLDEETSAPDLLLGEQLSSVHTWAATTATGDMAELGAHATPDVLTNLTRGVDTCEGSLCPFAGDCWAEKARARAGAADVVVTNHHLVFADAKLRGASAEAGGMPLPPDGVLILDEAHTLDDAATSAFSAHLDDGRAARIMNAPRVRAALEGDHTRAMAAVVGASARAFASLNRMVGLNRTTISDEIGAGLSLAETAQSLLDACVAISDSDTRAWVSRRIHELATDAERVFRLDDPAWVHFAERGRDGSITAHAAPLEVDRLIDGATRDRPAVIASSATLTVDRSFAYVLSRLGMGGAAELSTRPAFDYARQALVYAPADLEPPPTAGADDETYAAGLAHRMTELVEASGGGAFLLFTSRRALNDAWRRTRGAFPYPRFRQGDAAPADLLQRFRAANNGVLFGVRSFWEGVDVRGDALRLVVIARLPFAVPDDPVVAARTEHLRQEGANWFAELALPRAALLLKQGFGRLIRSTSDRGVVAVLDSRLRRRRYGQTILRSLPPAPITHRLDHVQRFFEARDTDGAWHPGE